MNSNRNKRLVLFDLDGVIIDSRRNMEKAWSAVQAQAGVTVPFERYFAEIGRAFGDIMERLDLGDQAVEAEKIFRMASMRHLDLIGFYEGVPETLFRLQENGFLLGVVTSKDTLRTNAILAMLPITFATVQTPNRRVRSKPAPDHLLYAMAEANADPTESLYIGDMNSDHAAAERAGVDYVHADWGYGERPAESTVELSAFIEIPALLGIAER